MSFLPYNWEKVPVTKTKEADEATWKTTTTTYGNDDWGFKATTVFKPSAGVVSKNVKAKPVPESIQSASLEDLARGNVNLNLFGRKTNLADKTNTEANKIADINKTNNIPSLGGWSSEGTFNTSGTVTPSPTAKTFTAGGYVKLASSIFTSGTSTEGATADIYEGMFDSPQNKIQSVVSDLFSVVNNSITGSLGSVLKKAAGTLGAKIGNLNISGTSDALDAFKSNLLSGVPLNKENVSKILQETIGYDGKSLNFKNGLKGLGDEIMGDIVKNIDGETGILTAYNSARKILHGDADTAGAMFGILDNILGNTKLSGFLNMKDTFALYSAVTKTLINFGAPELFDDLIEKIDEKDRNQYLKDNLSTGIYGGDLDFILFILKHKSGSWILAQYPQALEVIVSNYKPQSNQYGDLNDGEYAKLIKVLDQLDSDWDSVGIRNGMKRYNLGLFAKFNTQAKLAVIKQGTKAHIAMLLTAENFQGNYNIAEEAVKRYPLYPIGIH